MRFVKPHKTAFVISSILIVLGIIGISISLNINSAKQPDTKNIPDFATLLPDNTSIEELGGWQKLTPPNSDPYYVFVDSVDDTLIRVSQQQLPETFKDATNEKIAEIAQGYNTTQTFEVDEVKIYSGVSASGPQTLIFTKNNVLISIVAERQIADETWKTYISSLN